VTVTGAMRKLSSSKTFIHKKILPTFGLGFILLFACLVLWRGPIWFLIPLALMAVFGYVLMCAVALDLVDEVYFDGNEFVLRNAGEEDRFVLSNVINVDYGEMTKPERITLTLREPCKFGKQITFTPPLRFWRFGWHPIAKELLAIVRHIDL
jgi:hypothetical protein